jgi:predicted kinase
MLPSIYFSDFFKDLTVPCTNLKNLVKMSKFEGTVIVFDATFVTPKKRKKYIRLGKNKGANAVCLYCTASKKLILERNANRNESRKVPGFVVSKMIGSFVAPDKEEGFDLIVRYDSEHNEFTGDYVKVLELLEVD